MFQLTTPDERGVTLFQKHEQLARSKKSDGPELPSLPDFAERPMAWFRELSNARTAGMALNPITWEAMDAYFRLTGATPHAWEIRVLKAIDSAFLTSRIPPPKPKD